MNWSGAKSILIIFFLIINIIFLGILADTNRSIYNVDPRIMESTIDILKRSDITVDRSVIPDKNYKMKHAEAINVITDNMLFAEKMLGENVSESDGAYISDAGRLTITGDSFSTDYNDTEDFFNISGYSNVKKQFRHVIRQLGFSNTGNYDIEEQDGKYTAIINNVIDGKRFFDSSLCIVISENRVRHISGSWFSAETSYINSGEVKSITTALIDFMHQYQGEPAEIKDISIGYYKGEPDIYHKAAALIPVWNIVTADGKSAYIDARSDL